MEVWDGLYAALAFIVGAVFMFGAFGAFLFFASKYLTLATRAVWGAL